MGAVNCCVQATPHDPTWELSTRQHTPTKREAAMRDLPMYAFEPSLSLGLDECVPAIVNTKIEEAPADLVFVPTTPRSELDEGQDDPSGGDDPTVVILSPEGVVEVLDKCESRSLPPGDEETKADETADEAPVVPESLLAEPPSCPRSGKHQRRQSLASGSRPTHGAPLRRTQSYHEGNPEPRLEDYLCSCKYCPRAMTIQKAFQLYGFALDHPQSDSLLRVLRACANYDETVLEVDPLLVLHAEKMLEELNFDEDQTFRLLVASHFHPVA